MEASQLSKNCHNRPVHLAQVSPIQKAQDFAFGVLAVGTLPLIAWILAGFSCILISTFGLLLTPILALLTLILLARWRFVHRKCHISLWPLEIALGLALACFLFVKMTQLWHALGP